ncbi:MAG: deoxyribonuclease, partial [Halapricum sp.]
MEISNKLLCLFSANVSEDGDRYVIEVPKREIETGSIDPAQTY